MSFGQAVKVSFRKYATFAGRARRAEYWWFQLFQFLVQLPALVVFFIGYAAAFSSVFDAMDENGNIPESAADDINWGLLFASYIPLIVISLVLFLPGLAVLVRRLHDTGRSGWWYWISLVPGGSIVLLVFAVMEGQPHANLYGEDPKASERPWVAPYAYPNHQGATGLSHGNAYPSVPPTPPAPPALPQ